MTTGIKYRVTAQFGGGDGPVERNVTPADYAITAYLIALEALLWRRADVVTVERLLFFKGGVHAMRVLFIDTREVQA